MKFLNYLKCRDHIKVSFVAAFGDGFTDKQMDEKIRELMQIATDPNCDYLKVA